MARRARQVVVITGASAGIGRATAQAFAREGAHLALLARSREGLEGTAREVQALGGQALIIPTDVSRAEEVEAAASQVEREVGPIDIWVNNAMVSVFSTVMQMKPEEYEQVMRVNFLGYVHGTMSALRRMLPRDTGTIVQVSSALAYRSIPLQSAYCASKHAIVGFTESLLSELHHDRSKVHLTMVHLPAINTPQFDWVRSRLPNQPQPVPPIFQPEIPAKAIVWAAHHRRRAVTVGFPALLAINANKWVPGFADRRLAKTAYRDQQTDEPADPRRPDNLLTPAPSGYRTHGAFDAQSKRWSLQLWTNTHRAQLAALGLALLGLVMLGRKGALNAS